MKKMSEKQRKLRSRVWHLARQLILSRGYSQSKAMKISWQTWKFCGDDFELKGPEYLRECLESATLQYRPPKHITAIAA